MRRTRRMESALVVILTLAMVLGSIGAAYGATASQKREEAKKAQAAANAAKMTAAELEVQGHELMEKIEELNQAIAATTSKLKAKEKEVSTQEGALDDRLTAMYKTGTVGYIDVILSSEGISDLIQNVGMVQEVLESDQDLLKQLQDEYKQIDALKKEQEAQKKELADKQVEINAMVAQYKKVAATEQAKANQKNKEAAQLEAAAQQAAAGTTNSGGTSSVGGTTFVPTTSGYVWPTNSNYIITSKYGYRQCPFHGQEFHNGLDICLTSGSMGSPIRAVGDGVVTMAQWYSGYGNCVQISIGNGLVTLYGHLKSFNVSKGQKVSKGQVVGYMGSTGNSTGPHLHFTLYKNGTTISPYSLY